jgi:hypothetical protein
MKSGNKAVPDRGDDAVKTAFVMRGFGAVIVGMGMNMGHEKLLLQHLIFEYNLFTTAHIVRQKV